MSIAGSWRFISRVVRLGAGADLLLNSLGNIIIYLPWYLDTLLRGDSLADLAWDLLVHIDSILGTHRLGELSALLSGNIYWDILALFIRDISTLGSGNLFLNILGTCLQFSLATCNGIC